MLELTEFEFQSMVLEVAKYSGWLTYHTHDSRRSNAGFPDLVLVRGKVVIFAELKREKGRVRPEQKQWILALLNAGEYAVIWYPSDWDEIVKILTGENDERPSQS